MADVVKNHLQFWSKEPPSPIAIRVAELLHVWDGLHHFEESMMKKVEWDNPLYIQMRFRGSMSTFDFNQLTRLVFLAHDYCIRVEIKPCNNSCLTLLFHPRVREGTMTQCHPTLDQAFAQWRERHAPPALPIEAGA